MQQPPIGNTFMPHISQATLPHPPEVAPQPPPIRPSGVRHKLLYWALVVLALCISFPLGAYLTLRAGQHPFGSTSGATALTPIPTATLTLDQKQAQFIDQMIARLSLDEELGQLVVVAFTGTTLSPNLQTMIVNQHVGGVILFASNIQTFAQVQALDAAMQAHASLPLFISTDEEGGQVNRLRAIIGNNPSALDMGATNDPDFAQQQGQKDGKIMSQLGMNLDYAPVVDVQAGGFVPSVLATRMFGTTPAKVTTFAGAFLQGLQSQGVLACLKHWPGLGSTPVDPHQDLPTLYRSQADLNAIDFAPYRNLLQQGQINMIMVTHEVLPAYDPTKPASLSPIMVNGVMRHDLGYQGVVITDSLYMGALTKRWTIAQEGLLAIQAGDDLLLGPSLSSDVQKIIDGLKTALSGGQITKARIDQSVARILTLKIKVGLIKMPATVG
jgi:beta-N-acetylhexosaminidase